MPSTVVVVNPRSAGGKTERRWPQLRQIIHESYGPFEERFTKGPGDGTTLARDALKAGAELVVALGGDGTINEVVNGFFDGDTAAGGSFGVLPSGSGGDFVKTLGTATDLRRPPHSSRARRRRSTSAASPSSPTTAPSSAATSSTSPRSESPAWSTATSTSRRSRSAATVASRSRRCAPARIQERHACALRSTAGPPRDGKIYTVAVANGRFFGGGMKVAPEARLDDGLFDVVTLGDFSFADLVLRGLDIYSGKHVTNPKVTVHRARRVEAARHQRRRGAARRRRRAARPPARHLRALARGVERARLRVIAEAWSQVKLRVVKSLVALGCGVLLFLSCADFDIWPLTWIAHGPAPVRDPRSTRTEKAVVLRLALRPHRQRRRLLLDRRLSQRFGHLPLVAALPIFSLLIGYQAITFALFAWALRRLHDAADCR